MTYEVPLKPSESVRNVEKVPAICGAVRMNVNLRACPCVKWYQSAPTFWSRGSSSNASAGL